MSETGSKIETVKNNDQRITKKSTLLEKLYKTVMLLEESTTTRFKLTHEGRVEELKELIIFKEMIAIIEYLNQSINVTNLNLK